MTRPIFNPDAPNQSIFDAILAVYDQNESMQVDVDAIKAEALGSWQWDKLTGILTMYNEAGDEVAKFAVDDQSGYASRERRQDLEV